MTIPVLLLALAVTCWPTRPAATRVRALGWNGRQRRRLRLPTALPWPLGGGLVAYVLAGPGSGLAAAALVATVRSRLRARRNQLAVVRGVEGLAEALRCMVGELRTGAHPAAAAEHAAEDAVPVIATALSMVAATARLGGDVDGALAGIAAREPALAGVLGQVSRAWQLATRHGLPLADVLDAVRRDLDQRARFARQITARMAGPRSSAAVLAGLPVLGVLLGQAIGAAPLHVLFHSGIGQIMLVTGVLLVCAGVRWSARLTTAAVTP